MPRELGLLTNLTHLYLGNNQLTGEISGSLDDLTTLSLVRLAGGNSFTGCIPVGLQSVADHDLGDLGLPYCAPAEEGVPVDLLRMGYGRCHQPAERRTHLR